MNGLLQAGLLPEPGVPVVVAVSGGADSVALWSLLAGAGRWPLVVWHLDHALRAESAADAASVQALAGRLPARAVEIERREIASLARAWGCGLEEAGRRARYAGLEACARRHGAPAVATAHHRDDQAETVLHQLLRGAGPHGATGMPARRALAPGIAVVRPLLGAPRRDLRAHLAAAGLDWREDASNGDCGFHRNWLRHRVLPDLERGAPGLVEELVAAAERARAKRDALADQAAAAWREDGAGVALAPLLALPAPARGEAWRGLLDRLGAPLDRGSVARCESLAQAGAGARLHLGGWLLLRGRDRLSWRAVARGPRAGGRRTLTAAVRTGRGSTAQAEELCRGLGADRIVVLPASEDAPAAAAAGTLLVIDGDRPPALADLRRMLARHQGSGAERTDIAGATAMRSD